MAELLNREAYIKRFDQYLEQRQMRKTPERFAILRCVVATQSHFTVDTLMRDLERQSFHVSRATLYNTIQLLAEARLVRRHVFDGVQVQYEKAGNTPHSHLICTTCGKVKEVRDANFLAFMNAKKFTAFSVDFYSLYVYGTCSTCARKNKRQKSRKTEK